MHGIMKPDWSRDVIHASNNSSKQYTNLKILFIIIHNEIYILWITYLLKKKIKK